MLPGNERFYLRLRSMDQAILYINILLGRLHLSNTETKNTIACSTGPSRLLPAAVSAVVLDRRVGFPKVAPSLSHLWQQTL
jgi:hypothetical protein